MLTLKGTWVSLFLRWARHLVDSISLLPSAKSGYGGWARRHVGSSSFWHVSTVHIWSETHRSHALRLISRHWCDFLVTKLTYRQRSRPPRGCSTRVLFCTMIHCLAWYHSVDVYSHLQRTLTHASLVWCSSTATDKTSGRRCAPQIWMHRYCIETRSATQSH